MELLIDKPNSIRYRFVTTHNNKVYIVTYKHDPIITEDDEEDVEDAFKIIVRSALDGNSENSSYTEEYSTPVDEYWINKLNERIVGYCYKHSDAKQIHLVCGDDGTYQIIYESKVFKAMTECTSDIHFDLKTCAMRTDSSQYRSIKSLTFKSGVWFIEDDTTLVVKDVHFDKCEINVYNADKAFSKTLNLIIGKSCTGSQLDIYATLRTNFKFNSSAFNTPFTISRLSIPYLTFFGQEIVENDVKDHRCLVTGFHSARIGNLIINDEVQYGSIIKFFNNTSVSVCGVNRKVSQFNREGSLIIIDQVAKFKVYEIEYEIDEDSIIWDKSSLIKVINSKPESELKTTIGVYNSTLYNQSDSKLTLISIYDITLDMIYITDSYIDSTVDILKKDANSVVKKFSYNNSEIKSTESILINNAFKIALYNCALEVGGTLNLQATHISVLDCKFNCNKLYIDGDLIKKVSIADSEIVGSRIQVINRTGDITYLYFKNAKCVVDSVYIEDFISSFVGGMLKCKEFRNTGRSISFGSPIISVLDNFKETVFNICSSITGRVFLDDLDESYQIFFNIEDEKFYFKTSNIDFATLTRTPKIQVSTNTPMKVLLVNHLYRRFFFKITDSYDSVQPCKITKELTEVEELLNFKVINNSEKISTITEYTDRTGSKVFMVKKK